MPDGIGFGANPSSSQSGTPRRLAVQSSSAFSSVALAIRLPRTGARSASSSANERPGSTLGSRNSRTMWRALVTVSGA